MLAACRAGPADDSRSVAQGDGLLVGRVGTERRGVGRAGVEPDLLADPLVDLDHELGVLAEELLGLLPALAQLLALVRVPGTRLLHEAEVDADVEQRPLP